MVRRGSAIAALLSPAQASAHAGEQSFVLLLPTGYYAAGGVAAVALTALLVALMPGRGGAVFSTRSLGRSARVRGRLLTSCVACAGLMVLIGIGMAGTQDPTRNALPLVIWTLLWIGLVVVQGVAGDMWRWINPWDGPVAIARAAGIRPVARLPSRLGHLPALAGLMAVTAFLLTDPAPAAPERLARIALAWWSAHFAGALVFGRRWLIRAEPLGCLFRCYAALAPFGKRHGGWRVGLPGWQVLTRGAPSLSLALFIIALLATGSFDGLYETFWWLGLTGINPLDHPGRSAVVAPNLAGLLAAVPMLAAVYGMAVWLGLRLAGQGGFTQAFRALAPALLPIAFAYHVAHYLPVFLVDAQHAAIALNDPLARGANLLGLEGARVTTGFFNRLPSVRLIWLTQGAVIVAGHVSGILLSHAIALRLAGDPRRAVAAQAPLALLMVAYTLFGLWLLAAPRGG